MVRFPLSARAGLALVAVLATASGAAGSLLDGRA